MSITPSLLKPVDPAPVADGLPRAAGDCQTIGSCVEVEVFFDGDCPLCRREIGFLRRIDRRGRIRFTDIAAPEFDATRLGTTQAELMAEIRGRLPDGSWITGVEVFRRLYAAVGLRWLVAPTRLPGISHLLDWGYRVFARNRLRLTGRCTESCRIPESTKPPSSPAAGEGP